MVLWSLEGFRNRLYRPVISDLVGAEIADAPEEVHEWYEDLLDLEPEMIERTLAAEDLAEGYIDRGILSPNFLNDTLHIALATVADVDLLTSWNFKHVVHFDKIRKFNSINQGMGYKPIQIHSPREVTHYGNQSG